MAIKMVKGGYKIETPKKKRKKMKIKVRKVATIRLAPVDVDKSS